MVLGGVPRPAALDLALELVEHRRARRRQRERRLGLLERRRASAARQTVCCPIMPLADTFQQIVDSLPTDWTDLELDLRVDEDRYVEAAIAARDVQRAALLASTTGTGA